MVLDLQAKNNGLKHEVENMRFFHMVPGKPNINFPTFLPFVLCY